MPDSGIRDQLAAERTHLANERTFLAYVRTGLALCAGGVTFLQFYRSSGTLPIGYLLLVLGSGGVVAGAVRFFRARARIRRAARQDD